MTDVATQDVLRSSPFFADIEADDLDALAAGARYADYARGQRVFAEGDPATRLSILVEGSIRLSVSGPGVDAVVPRPEPLMTIRHAGYPIGWSALWSPTPFAQPRRRLSRRACWRSTASCSTSAYESGPRSAPH
jgi:hypothetical protein